MSKRSDFSEDRLFRLAVQEFYESLAEQLEDLLEQLEESKAIDADFFEPQLAAGSLSVVFEDGSVFMLSQQTPTHEIWLSANYTAWHFLCESEQWVERDTGLPIKEVLEQLFSDKIGTEVQIRL